MENFIFCVVIRINDTHQAVDYDLFPYEDDTCLVSQHKNINKIDENLNKNFSNICVVLLIII